MEENGPLSPSQQLESFHNCFAGITDEDVPSLVRNESIFKRICEALLKAFKPLEKRESDFERLLQVIRKLALRSEDLQQLICSWQPKRQAMIKTIEEETKVLSKMTIACNSGRLVSSIVDTAGLIGGLLIGESNDRYSNLAFSTGKVCRIIGFSASALELFKRKSVLEKLVFLIQEDQTAFAPIQAFFLQDSELEEAIKDLLPFKITSRLIEEFLTKAVEDEISQTEMLQMILGPLLLEDAQRIRDSDLIQNLVAFTTCPAATDWYRWIILRHHKVTLDIEAMLLQVVNPQTIVGNHSIGLTASGDRPTTLSVLSRIGLNCVTFYDALSCLTSGGMVEKLRQIHSHLRQEMNTVVQISRLLHLRR